MSCSSLLAGRTRRRHFFQATEIFLQQLDWLTFVPSKSRPSIWGNDKRRHFSFLRLCQTVSLFGVCLEITILKTLSGGAPFKSIFPAWVPSTFLYKLGWEKKSLRVVWATDLRDEPSDKQRGWPCLHKHKFELSGVSSASRTCSLPQTLCADCVHCWQCFSVRPAVEYCECKWENPGIHQALALFKRSSF